MLSCYSQLRCSWRSCPSFLPFFHNISLPLLCLTVLFPFLLNISPPVPVWQSTTSTGKERSEETTDRGPKERRRYTAGYRSYTPQKTSRCSFPWMACFSRATKQQQQHTDRGGGVWGDNVMTSNLFPSSDLNISHHIKQQALEHDARRGRLRQAGGGEEAKEEGRKRKKWWVAGLKCLLQSCSH